MQMQFFLADSERQAVRSGRAFVLHVARLQHDQPAWMAHALAYSIFPVAGSSRQQIIVTKRLSPSVARA